MPNWKKVLLSGSKASVFDITASNLPGEPDKTTDVVVITDQGYFLTASRNDFGAASGPDKAVQFAYTEDGIVFQNSGSDKFTFDEENVELIISAAGEGQINVGRTDKPSSGETLGSLNFVGTGSFTMEGPTAKIEAVATQDYTVHAKGGKLNFYTSNKGASGTPSGLGNPKMVISESGILFDPSNNGYEVGISQNKVGGSATMEFTTQDSGGSQATKLLLRGNGEFSDIEFYSGNSGSETQIGAISSEFASFAFGSDFGTGATLDDNIKKATILAFGNISTTGSEGHITASGNISASGYISSSYAYISENGGSRPTLTIERQSGQPNIQSTNWFIADATGSATVNPGNKAAINYWSDRHVLLANGGGNVGIGDFGSSTDPGERLEVRGNISASGNLNGYNLVVGNDGSLGSPSIYFDSDTNTGFYHPPASDTIGITTGGSTRVTVSNSGTVINSGYLKISNISEDTSNSYRPVVVNTSDGQLYYTASDAFGGGGGGGTLDEVTTSGNQTNNTIRVGELTASLVDDPADINTAISGDWANNGSFIVRTVNLGTGVVPGATNNFSFSFSGIAGFGDYTGPLYMQRIEVRGDFDAAAGEGLDDLTIGGHTFIDNAFNFTPDFGTTFATIFSGSYSGDFNTTFNSASPPSNNYPELSTDGNFSLSISDIGDTQLYGVTCTNGVVNCSVFIQSGVSTTSNASFKATFRKPSVTYNSGNGLYSGVDSNNRFAAQIKHLGAPSSGQDPNGLLITLGSSDSQNNAEFIRFTGIEGSIPTNVSITPGAILSTSELGSIINDGGVATLSPPSDKRLKKDIIPMSSSLSNILNVDPVHYTWKSSNIKNIGFIAQDLYEHMPEAVIKGDENTIWKLNYNNIIPYLVKAIQEQQVIIEDLKTKIDNLLK